MRIIVRKAGSADARQMAELLNEIIAIGGTTAITTALTKDGIAAWMASHTGKNSWVVAEDDSGKIMGFQLLEPHPDLPDNAADVATFVRAGSAQLGIGSKLFDGTRKAANRLGYTWINATIRADNTGGLAYYGSRGFETYQADENVPLSNGLSVGKVHKRYNL